MVASSIIVLAASLSLVSAQVFPFKPAADVYKTGEDCIIEWNGDKNSTTAWKDMAIELMTGDNYQMVHLTTVTTGQDGTIDGKFVHKCPGVSPNAAIYFYQFTAPAITRANWTWTTRFTIAGEDGSTEQPTNATQPDANHTAIAWGTGKLLDPSIATPPPDFQNQTTTGTQTTTTAEGTPTEPPTGPIGNNTACTDTHRRRHQQRSWEGMAGVPPSEIGRRMISVRSQPIAREEASESAPSQASPSSGALGRQSASEFFLVQLLVVGVSCAIGYATVL